jgi:raffinose/stachyose/melibiose transport system substrate-binding protein
LLGRSTNLNFKFKGGRKVRKILVLTLVIFMVFVLFTGCGRSQNDETKAKVSTVEEETSGVKPEKPVKIRYLTWTYADRGSSTDLFIEKAMNELKVDIELENFPTDQYETTIRTKSAASDLPELVNLHNVSEGSYGGDLAEHGALQEIGEFDFVKDFYDSVLDACVYRGDGKLYMIASNTNMLGVLYNKKVFKDLGLDIPQNIDEFNDVCEKVKANNIIPISAGFKDAFSLNFYIYLGFGEYVFKDFGSYFGGPDALKNQEIKFTDPEVYDAYKFVLDFRDKGYFQPNEVGTDLSAASALIANGKAAMHVDGNWQLTAIKDANPDAEIGFFPLPLNQKGSKKAMLVFPGAGLAMSKIEDKEKSNASIKSLKLYYGAEIQQAVCEDVNGIPANKNVIMSNNPFLTEAQLAMNDAMAVGSYKSNGLPAYAKGLFNLDNIVQDIYVGGSTIEEATAEIQGKIDEAAKKQ